MTGKIQRNWQEKGEKLLSWFPVLVIIGPRQCGKTVLSTQMRPEWRYFDLENGADYDLITGDPAFFFRENPEHLIIDEAQLSPELFRELRGVIDRDREKKNRFILTGSSSPELLKNITETLAGRAAVIELGTLAMNEQNRLPLSDFFAIIGEGLSGNTAERLLQLPLRLSHDQVQDAFLWGGYPEPVLSGDRDFHRLWMEQYYNSYIQRDIRSLFPRLELVKYRRFLNILSSLNGTVINHSEAARSLDVSMPTVKDYLEIAQGSFLWRNLPSYETSSARSAVKKPKGHFRDSGLNLWLSRINSREMLMGHPGAGACFESFITEELIKGFSPGPSTRNEYFYYRTRNGAEIDFLIRGDFGTLPVEIKYGIQVKRGALRWMKQFLEENDLPLGLVINNSDRVVKLSERILQVPAGVL